MFDLYVINEEGKEEKEKIESPQKKESKQLGLF